MLDEVEKRKPNWSDRDSVAVAFADGQEWRVPKPWLEIRPRFENGVARTTYPVYTCGVRLDALLDAIADADAGFDRLAATATLAAELLSFHYDLADDDLDQLLAFRQGVPDSAAWIERVIGIATGQSGPKVSSVGSG